MPKLSTLLIFINSIFLVSCYSWKDGEYTIDTHPAIPSSKSLYIDVPTGGKIGRKNYVTKIGSDDNYIIIESKSDMELEYWILDKKKDNPYYNANEIVEGPYTKLEFQNKKREREIEATFEKSFNSK